MLHFRVPFQNDSVQDMEPEIGTSHMNNVPLPATPSHSKTPHIAKTPAQTPKNLKVRGKKNRKQVEIKDLMELFFKKQNEENERYEEKENERIEKEMQLHKENRITCVPWKERIGKLT